MSRADELAIAKARAAATASQSRHEREVATDEAMLTAFPRVAREVLQTLEQIGYDIEEMRLLRIPRLVRRRTFFRDAEYIDEERAGWLLHQFTYYWGGENLVHVSYWLVSDGTFATGGRVDGPALAAGIVDMREEFDRPRREHEVRYAYAGLVALGRRYAARPPGT